MENDERHGTEDMNRRLTECGGITLDIISANVDKDIDEEE